MPDGAAAPEMTAERVKALAADLGADLVGIASAETLNAFPPDPRWPQTPDRVSPHVKSVVAVVQHIPVAAFRAKTNIAVQYIDMLVLRRMDRIAFRIAEALEDAGHPSFVTAAQETDWNLKRASYGRLSTRHLGIEAGLGTFGLEVNILTPEYGPRVYLTGILTEAELEPDEILTEQVCIGESCSRCLYSCPSDAVRHFGIDKRGCATEAQEFGYAQITGFFDRYIGLDREQKRDFNKSRGVFGFWQGLLRVVGSFGDCPRCLAVCPVGNDYHAYLAEVQKFIPEKTPQKVEKAKAFKQARRDGAEIDGLNDWNARWVGPDGYRGMVARQVQAFKQAQREREAGFRDKQVDVEGETIVTIITGPNIEAINDLSVVEAILKRAKNERDFELTNRCIRRRAILEGRAYDDPLSAELWTAVHALEAVRTEEAGKTIRLSRTREMMKCKSAHEILAGWATAGKETTGFKMLMDRNMLDLSGEAIVVRHADKFEPHVVEAAENRLSEAGYTPSASEPGA